MPCFIRRPHRLGYEVLRSLTVAGQKQFLVFHSPSPTHPRFFIATILHFDQLSRLLPLTRCHVAHQEAVCNPYPNLAERCSPLSHPRGFPGRSPGQ